MSPNPIRLLLFALPALAAGAAQAAATYDCSLGAPTAFTDSYSTSSNSPVALSVAVTCTKTGFGLGTTIVATVTPNDGLWFSGSQNQGASGGNRIKYDLYTDATCGTLWTGSGPLTFTFLAGAGSSQTQTVGYYGCVPSAQALLPAAATFTDTVSQTLALPTPGGALIAGTNPQTFAASITVPAVCSVSTAPGNISFGSYTAFQASAITQNTTFGIICNQNLTPYSLDVGGGAQGAGVVGTDSLRYELLVSTSSSGGSNPLSSLTGSGLTQTYWINGTLPAGQAGTCAAASCLQSETRTLTVTY